MPKVLCTEITCEHNKENRCVAKEINLSAGDICTLYDGRKQIIWNCQTFEMSEESKKILDVIEWMYARGETK